MKLELSVNTDKAQEQISLLMRLLRVGKLGKVTNSGVDYAPYVQDHREQAWMHRGRWQTVQSVNLDYEDIVAEQIAEALQTAIDGGGEIEFRIEVDEVLELLLEAMQKYPPPPPGSRYVRTDRLKRAWRKRLLA